MFQSQKGFRAGRSTMSALASVQQKWAENTANNLITGVLLRDFSAAFDTLNIGIFCDKLKICGFKV